MDITNKFNAPEPLVNLMKRSDYNRGNAQMSVSQVYGSPRQRLLFSKHYHELTDDVSDRLWALMGSALHYVVSHGADENNVAEERMYADVAGWRISGRLDLHHHDQDPKDVDIIDYKFTSVYALAYSDGGSSKTEWIEQLNAYAWLCRHGRGYRVTGLQVCCLLRDWKAAEAKRKGKGYPETPIHMVTLPLWSDEKQDEWVEARVRAHQIAEGEFQMGDATDILECTDEERWIRPSTFAVMKKGGKRAKKVEDTEEKAQAWIDEKVKEKDRPDHEIVERISRPIRCEEYCLVSTFCDQFETYRRDHADLYNKDGSPKE